MIRKILCTFFACILVAIAGLIVCLSVPALRISVGEALINQSLHEYFNGSVRLTNMQIDPQFRITLTGLNADFQAPSGPVPINIERIASRGSLLNWLVFKPVQFDYYGARTLGSIFEGIDGTAEIKLGEDWSFRMKGNVRGMGLEDLALFNPAQLAGSSGKLSGDITLTSDARQDPAFGLSLRVERPGGNLQARFFDALLPYLPQAPNRTQVEKITARARFVAYREAALTMELLESDRIKVFLHIIVPEYNLVLNLNLEIRVDEKNAFSQLAALLGLFEVTLS